MAQTALYPADVDVAKPRATCRSRSTTARQHLAGGKWDRIDWREVQGAPAVEIDRHRSPAATCCASSSLLKGRRFVSLGYLAPADASRFPRPSVSSAR